MNAEYVFSNLKNGSLFFTNNDEEGFHHSDTYEFIQWYVRENRRDCEVEFEEVARDVVHKLNPQQCLTTIVYRMTFRDPEMYRQARDIVFKKSPYLVGGQAR